MRGACHALRNKKEIAKIAGMPKLKTNEDKALYQRTVFRISVISENQW